MIAVRARYIGATDTKPSRISIRWNDGSRVLLPINYAASSDNMKRNAAAEANNVSIDHVQYVYELPNGDTIYMIADLA